MKKAGAELFGLIHSLSMAEKKYFKIFSSMKGGDKSYLKLYDVIQKQRRYNEDAIHITCRGQKFLRHLSVTNSRLYNNILRSLENYHNSADINLPSQLRKVEILLRKGLITQALKLLKAAKTIAYEHERWELLMEILVMERTPYSATDLLKMAHLNEDMEVVQEKLNNIHDYRKIHHKIMQRIQEAGPTRTKKEQLFIEKLIQHPLLRNSKQASCTEAKIYYYEIRSRYYLLKRDFIKGYQTSKEQCDFIETHFHQLRDPGKRHLFALNLLLIFLGNLLPALTESNTRENRRTRQSHQTNRNKYSEMQEILKKIRNYPIIFGSLKAQFWISSYTNELNAYIMAGDFERIFPVLKAIEENKDMLNQTTVVMRSALYYNIAYMLFGAGSYNESLRWLRRIIDQPAGALRKDIQASAHILSLLIHYELHKDEQMLDSLKRSALYFLSTRHRLFKLEKTLMYCLSQIMGKPISRKERTLAFQALKVTLLKLMKNPIEKAAMDNFDFLSWVESKIQNKTFAEVMREKAK